MTEMLIIADDLTGAIDAAASCMGAGAEVLTACPANPASAFAADAPRVLSVNAATRHMDPKAACEQVERLVAAACNAGVRIMVKKTDSVLRGNVGAELEGALRAAGAPAIHFIPSFPALGRITVGGVHRVDGVPVAESPLGHDPFEPVLSSDISSIIATTSTIPVAVVAEGAPAPTAAEGVIAYDAATDAAIDARLRTLLATAQEPLVLAGCAGLVGSLARVLGLPPAQRTVPAPAGSLLAFCGSVNAVSVGQCAYAAHAGAPVYPIAARSLLEAQWTSSPAFDALAHELAQALATHRLVVADASTRATAADLAAAHIAPGTDTRSLVARHLGVAAASLLRGTQVANLLVMGGDVLLELLDVLKVPRLSLVAEVAVGVVVFEAAVDERRVRIVSKSGGFGEPDLFLRVADALCATPSHPITRNQSASSPAESSIQLTKEIA